MFWTPPDGRAVAHRGRAHASAGRLLRALRVSAARGRGLRGARILDALPQQRHRLPARARARATSRPRPRGCGARRRRRRAVRQQRRRIADGARARRARLRRRLGRRRRPSRRRRVHDAGDRPVGGRRTRSVLGRSPSSTCTTPPTAGGRGPSRARTTRRGSTRYRAAERARVARIDAHAHGATRRRGARARGALRALERGTDDVAALRRRAVHLEYMTIYRTLADPAYLDPRSIPTTGRSARCSRFPTRSTRTTGGAGWRGR